MFLVRHAKAGHRSHDLPDDGQRPLTKAGRQQAEALVEPLISAGAAGPLLSSPSVRCIQTIEPLAERLGGEVVGDDRLGEGKPFLPMLELMNELPDGAVLCSHGDMIPDVIQALERRGCAITSVPNWKKASVWVLGRDDSGRFVTASAWPPPED